MCFVLLGQLSWNASTRLNRILSKIECILSSMKIKVYATNNTMQSQQNWLDFWKTLLECLASLQAKKRKYMNLRRKAWLKYLPNSCIKYYAKSNRKNVELLLTRWSLLYIHRLAVGGTGRKGIWDSNPFS